MKKRRITKRRIKRLVAILICALGIVFVLLAGAVLDLAIRALAITAGIGFITSGAIRLSLLRRHRRRKWGTDVAY